MLLENNFYKVLGVTASTDGSHGVFHLALLPDCDVYRGHFPGHPVCPGVFNIETIKECAMHLCRCQLAMPVVKQCRFTAVASPAICPEVDLDITLSPISPGTYGVSASIADVGRVYVEFKGEMTVI